MKLTNKFAIGCLVQWYEIEIIEEYLQSLKNALELVDNRENVIIDLYFYCGQKLEKIDKEQKTMPEIIRQWVDILDRLFDGYKIHNIINRDDEYYTISDYRREFNTKYCTEVDVLMWGESDALLPDRTFERLDNLHTNVKESTPKYVTFFGTCKMWDESWKVVEHTKFTDKPFIENDTESWWSLKYTMTIDEMNKINADVEDLDVRVLDRPKFNGCGLVISSDIIKSGVNIPQSAFFVHEDTAFMLMLHRVLGGIPQYVIKNILLVHNRKHPRKRLYVQGEKGIKPGDVGKGRHSHTWYTKANKMSEHNVYNMFNQTKLYTWEDAFDEV